MNLVIFYYNIWFYMTYYSYITTITCLLLFYHFFVFYKYIKWYLYDIYKSFIYLFSWIKINIHNSSKPLFYFFFISHTTIFSQHVKHCPCWIYQWSQDKCLQECIFASISSFSFFVQYQLESFDISSVFHPFNSNSLESRVIVEFLHSHLVMKLV